MNILALKGQIPDSVFNQLPVVIDKFKINTASRLAHLLGQTAHESGNFKRIVEGLNYKDVKRIALIFKRDVDLNHDKVINEAELNNAKRYVNKPVELANFVYANQNGNGTEASGDGYKFRGRGYIQLTGRANYASFAKYIGEDVTVSPDLVATKYPLASAAWFFVTRKLNEVADKGVNDATISSVSKTVNGGLHGLAERKLLTKKFYTLLNKTE